MTDKRKNIKGKKPEDLTTYEEGNKHENGGIPIPNFDAEVEKGETKMGTYVFSDDPQMKLTKTLAKEVGLPEKYAGKKFSEVSKEIEKQYSERENDVYTDNAKEKEFDRLEAAQEKKKQEEAQKALEKYRSLTGGNEQPQPSTTPSADEVIGQNPSQAPQQGPPQKMQQPPQQSLQRQGGPQMFPMGGQMNPYLGGGTDDEIDPRYSHLNLSDEARNYQTYSDQPTVPLYEEGQPLGDYNAMSGNRADELNMEQEELQRRMRNRQNYTKFQRGGGLDRQNQGAQTTRTFPGSLQDPEKMERKKKQQQGQAMEQTAGSTLSAINPLIGTAFQVGSAASDQVAPGGDMTVESGDTDAEKARKGAAWNLNPFGYAVQTTQEEGFNAESVGRVMLANTVPGGGTILANKAFGDPSDSGMESDKQRDAAQPLRKGGDMKNYNYGGEYQRGGNLTKADLTEEDLTIQDFEDYSAEVDRMRQESPTTKAQYDPVDRVSKDRGPGQPETPESRTLSQEEKDMYNIQPTEQENNISPFERGLSAVQKAAPFIKPLTGAATMIGGPEEVDYDRVDPEEVDYSSAREAARRQAALSRARAEEGVRKGARSAGQLLQGNITANIASQNAAMKNLLPLHTQEQNQNAQIRNRAERINAEIQRQEEIAGAKNRGQFDRNITNIAGDVGRGLSGVERDRKAYEAEAARNRMMMDAMNRRAPNYRLVPYKDEEGNVRYRREFISPEEDAE